MSLLLMVFVLGVVALAVDVGTVVTWLRSRVPP